MTDVSLLAFHPEEQHVEQKPQSSDGCQRGHFS
jgi:hypothetical protein